MERPSPFVGLFVLDGPAHVQGRIFGVEGGLALVELYSWMDGRQTEVAVVPVAEFAPESTWRLFRSEAEWKSAADKLISAETKP